MPRGSARSHCRRSENGVPVIEMTRVPGEPLGGEQLSPAQVGALAHPLRRIWAIPSEALTPIPERLWVGRRPPGELFSLVRSWVRDTPPRACALASDALQDAAAWLDSADLSNLSGPLAEQVFTHGDGNLGNFLWDGARCRVVDFEDAGVSDPAYEAADLLEHVSVRLRGLIEADDLIEALSLTPRLAHAVTSPVTRRAGRRGRAGSRNGRSRTGAGDLRSRRAARRSRPRGPAGRPRPPVRCLSPDGGPGPRSWCPG